tara:strand:+ start:57 stop:218 length:162 start_codon:yes stop_codon:yes gene_type:complete
MKLCDMCYGKGYLLDVNEDENIERCDECKDTSYGFKSDQEAKEFYLNNKKKGE